MKSSLFISFLSIPVALLLTAPTVQAQKNTATEISYNVTFGPVFPIEGSSSQLNGQISMNDTTDVLEKLDFDVPLYSFIGQNAGYLAWVGNSWTYPEMSFRSNKISQKGNEYTVHGNLEFRGRNAPAELKFIRNDKGNEIILGGEFVLYTSDYFIIQPSFELVPSQIPFQLTMAFDKPTQDRGAKGNSGE